MDILSINFGPLSKLFVVKYLFNVRNLPIAFERIR